MSELARLGADLLPEVRRVLIENGCPVAKAEVVAPLLVDQILLDPELGEWLLERIKRGLLH